MFVKDIDNNIIGEGIAKSKKEAEQKAAKAALMHFGISNGF
jgi:dsRNA-specific ribonuclease